MLLGVLRHILPDDRVIKEGDESPCVVIVLFLRVKDRRHVPAAVLETGPSKGRGYGLV